MFNNKNTNTSNRLPIFLFVLIFLIILKLFFSKMDQVERNNSLTIKSPEELNSLPGKIVEQKNENKEKAIS